MFRVLKLGRSLMRRRLRPAVWISSIAAVVGALAPSPLWAAFTAVPTFECVGLYWSPTGGASNVQATVRYKITGTSTWNSAQDLWFAPAENGRPAEYRGSIVGLQSGTTYDVELDLAGAPPAEVHQFTTWSDNFPIVQTIQVTNRSTPLEINDVHGSPTGYILYTGPATIDVANAHPYNIRVRNSDYVIIRGLTLTGARNDGIMLGDSGANNTSNVHDIIIENNDISNWGTVHANAPAGSNWGNFDESGVRSSSSNLQRIVIQRNRIHHPRTDSNSWKEPNPANNNSSHPNGPQAITFENNFKGNIVIRYNEIYGDNDHRFNDGMGSDQNFGYTGFPRQDSDIYGNYIAYVWDDGIESEGANMNVRIWGNYLTETYHPFGLAGTTMGPLYVFRNVANVSRTAPTASYGQSFFKVGSNNATHPSNGKTYIYHNTALKPQTGQGPQIQGGITDGDRTYNNFVVRNNILQTNDPTSQWSIEDDSGSTTNSYDYDLYNGRIKGAGTLEPNGIVGVPTHVAGWGYNLSTHTGIFSLANGSLGLNSGVVLPNFTTGYQGTAPDAGAHEAGTPPMEFGVNAYTSELVSVVPAGDTYVRDGAPTTPQGGGVGTNLVARADSDSANNNNSKTYIKFNLAGRSPDPNASATIKVTISAYGGQGNGPRFFRLWGLNAGYSGTTNWNETTLTWNNAPANDPAVTADANFLTSQATLIYSQSISATSPQVGVQYTWTIPRLGDFLQADNTVTLMIGSTEPVSRSFASREHATVAWRPTLTFLSQ